MMEEPSLVKKVDTWYDGILRMWQAWLVSILLLVVIYFLQPQQIGILFYKTFFIFWGAAVGYWIDRWLAPYNRPHMESNTWPAWVAPMRRTAIVCFTMISFALAV